MCHFVLQATLTMLKVVQSKPWVWVNSLAVHQSRPAPRPHCIPPHHTWREGGEGGERREGGGGGERREGRERRRERGRGAHHPRCHMCGLSARAARNTHTHQLCRSARVNVTFRRAATTTNTHSLTHSITYSYGRHTVGTHSSTSSAIVRLRAQVVKGETLSFRQIRLASPLPKKFPSKKSEALLKNTV